ncbi:hypothetical protein [Sorangium sp. So ce542]
MTRRNEPPPEACPVGGTSKRDEARDGEQSTAHVVVILLITTPA